MNDFILKSLWREFGVIHKRESKQIFLYKTQEYKELKLLHEIYNEKLNIETNAENGKIFGELPCTKFMQWTFHKKQITELLQSKIEKLKFSKFKTYVVSLNLFNCSLNSLTEVASFRKLKFLAASCNVIKSLPRDLPVELECLILNHNCFDQILLNEVLHLKNVSFSYNKITKISFDDDSKDFDEGIKYNNDSNESISQTKSLEYALAYLDVSFNRISNSEVDSKFNDQFKINFRGNILSLLSTQKRKVKNSEPITSLSTDLILTISISKLILKSTSKRLADKIANVDKMIDCSLGNQIIYKNNINNESMTVLKSESCHDFVFEQQMTIYREALDEMSYQALFLNWLNITLEAETNTYFTKINLTDSLMSLENSESLNVESTFENSTNRLQVFGAVVIKEAKIDV